MASRGDRTEPRRPAPRLYLVTPRLAEPAGFRDVLASALDAGDVAAVLLRLADADERTLINRVKELAPIVQGKGAALLLDGRPELVARADADGAHLHDIDAFTAALESLKPERIAGCSGLTTRHDAMMAGESGADYVMFGDADADEGEFDTIVDRLSWWAEVFEIPCVGFAAQLDQVEVLAATGADFVALGDAVFSDARGPAAAIADAARLTTAEAVQ